MSSQAQPGLTACSYREHGDDFFCLRYQVWYASMDCAVRTRFQTSPGCTRCEQGRFNLKRHADTLKQDETRYRLLMPSGG